MADLPKPVLHWREDVPGRAGPLLSPLFTAAQLEAYADARVAEAVAAERDRCARLAEQMGPVLCDSYGDGAECIATADAIAGAIRGSVPERGSGGGQLTTAEREALALLSDRHGTTTGDIAQQMPSMRIWAYSRGVQSQKTLTVLRRLQACGLVKRMDNETPVVWMLARPNTQMTGAIRGAADVGGEAHAQRTKR